MTTSIRNADAEEAGLFKHWPALLLGAIVVIIFLFSIFSYQVESTEYGVVTTFGKITSVKSAGLHFRWPYPIQKIERFDNRLRCFEGGTGKTEETYTADSQSIIVGIFITYKIIDPQKLFRTVVNIYSGEDRLNSLMRSVKVAVIGTHKFDEFININPGKMRIGEIEEEMRKGLDGKARKEYGVEIVSAGIKSLAVPEKISEKVFERMKAERAVLAQKYRSEGKSIAQQIKNEADNKRKIKLAEAEAEAKRIQADGDAKAATYYSVFKEAPELADFLRKLDTLKKIIPKKTTLILNTKYPPFDLLELNPESLGRTLREDKLKGK